MKPGIAATVICYRGRSAIREVGKVFGLSEDTVRWPARSGSWSMEGVSQKEARRAGVDPSDPRIAQVLALTQELIGFPRHLSQHVGRFVITRGRLDEVVPIENAAMEDRTFVEWDKDDLNELNILKVDVLGLGMLSCLRRSLRVVADLLWSRARSLQHPRARRCRLPHDPARRYDRRVPDRRAQMSMLPRLKPVEFYDLVIEKWRSCAQG